MNKTLKRLGLASTLVLTLIIVTACAGDSSEGGEVRDELVIAMAQEPRSLDLHRTNDNPAAIVTRQIFETLVLQDENMDILPGLAHHWEPYNDRIWEFHLNEGVYFHNGERLTAYDVAASLTNAAQSPQVAAVMSIIDVDTIEVVDDLTVRVGTAEPFAPFLSHLAHTAAGIMNADDLANAEEPDDADDFTTNLDRHPNGTGPFMVVDPLEWVSGSQITLHRFEDYHATIPGRDLPSFETMIFMFIGDPTARMAALETGEVHIDLNPTVENFARVEREDGLRLDSIPGLRTDFLGLNQEHEHLSNRLVRQAINYATDVEGIIEAIYEGHGVVGQTVISASVFGHNPDIEGFPLNVERAQELMIEAGLEAGFDITLHVNTERQDRIDIAQILQQQLREINIEINIVTIDFPQLLDMLDDGEADLFLLGWTSVTGDGDYALFPLFHTSQHGSPGNYSRFSNAEVDALLDEARVSTDADERLDLYFRVQEILREEAPWVIMLQEEESAFVNYGVVDGFILSPARSHYFGNITLSDE